MRRLSSAVATGLLFGGLARAQPGQQQRVEAPKWLDDDGKELFGDIENDENLYGDLACENREKLLKAMAGKGDSSAAYHRSRVLLGLGYCAVKKENWPVAKKRLDSAISEMNVPSEDMMLKTPELAPIALSKQASDFMRKFEVTQAGTQFRRAREVLDRNLKSILKRVHQQMSQGKDSLPLERLLQEIPGYGKTGEYLPLLVKQVQGLREVFSHAEIVDGALDALDQQVAMVDSQQKKKKLRLDVSKGKAAKTGSMLYVRSIFTEPIFPADRLAVAKELIDQGVTKAVLASRPEKSASLLKRSKAGSGCKDSVLAPICEKLAKIPDIQSNAFGESRLMLLKENKKQVLDTCTTNANIGLLVSNSDGVRLTVAGESRDLKAGEVLGLDFCLEASLDSPSSAAVLFAQAWHPEFAAVERTSELRLRGTASFGLSEEEVKQVTKVVNDHAKQMWEKTAKTWRSNSVGLESMKKTLQSKEEDKVKAKEEADEAKRKEEEAGDEERKKNLEMLEKKRAEKRRQQEEAEKKRLARKKQLEEERAKRDPWLLFPEVIEAEKHLEDLKEQRRDANAKLEFDLSNSLTKDISAAERALKSVTKKAKKAYKKGGKPEDGAAAETKTTKTDELKDLKAKLKDLKERKEKASQAENFKEAKKLKAEQKDLEEKIARLEL